MTAVVKSQLNPLADAFIPTSRQNSLQRKKSIQHFIENKTKISWEGRKKMNSNDQKSEFEKSEEIEITLDIRKNPLWNDIFFFGSVTSMLNVFLKNSVIVGKKTVCMTSNLQPPMLPDYPEDSDQVFVKKAGLIKTPIKLIEEKMECNCPPMFGWVIPPEFIGNPFNFNFACNKKYPHSSNSTKAELDFDKLDFLDKKINDLTLDQCYSEIKDILTDVYEAISVDSGRVSKWDEKCKSEDFLEMSNSDVNNRNESKKKHLGSDSTAGITTLPELIDDGCHPLLQSAPCTKEEDEKELVKVEKILEKSLMYSSLPESLNCVTLDPGTACDPPCSVWCEFLPSAAKDTFKRYIQKSGSGHFNEACHQRLSFRHRPICKRSLSADDAPIFGRFNGEVESREMLLLRRKDPLNYFRNRSYYTSINGRKRGSCDLRDGHLFTNPNDDESNMWGKFDGADSLWQALPDCMPVGAHYQKQNGHKRGRESRRQ